MGMALDWIMQDGTDEVTVCTDGTGASQSYTAWLSVSRQHHQSAQLKHSSPMDPGS